MADAIAATAADGWEASAALARDQLRASFALDAVRSAWTDLLHA
jgi:hypothetical protein